MIKKLFSNKYNNLFNFDPVDAKTGKILTDREKSILYWCNIIPSKLYIFGGILMRVFILATVIKLLLMIWN